MPFTAPATRTHSGCPASSLRYDLSPVIRHEAAFLHEAIEALGDLGANATRVRRFLRKLCADETPFIQDTAEIALATVTANGTSPTEQLPATGTD